MVISKQLAALVGIGILLTLGGCANLDAVRSFGQTAATAPALSDISVPYRESATTVQPYLTDATRVPSQNPTVRDKQIAEARVYQTALTTYFSTLAKLAGADAFSLDKQIDSVAKGAQSIVANANDVSAAAIAGETDLAKILAKYVTLAAQESAVHGLIREGGPHAMDVLAALRKIASDWANQVKNEGGIVTSNLTGLGAVPQTPPLLRMLAMDRASVLAGQYQSNLAAFSRYDATLDRIANAHWEMVQHLDDLTSSQLKASLTQAVRDLKSAQADLLALRN